jgi:hypothetical protein
MTESEKHTCEKNSTTSKQKSSQNYGGFFWGIVIASFGIFLYVMNLSTYEFQRTSKISRRWFYWHLEHLVHLSEKNSWRS